MHGWRRILLPEHSVQACREAMKDLEVTGQPNPHGVLFPARNGSLRNPNNFGRVRRAARGDNYAWVTPRTFRRVVATVIDNAYGDPERAARQLGNTYRGSGQGPLHRRPRDLTRQPGGPRAVGPRRRTESVRFL